MEIDTPMQHPRICEINKLNDKSLESSSCRVPEFFKKEDVNPVKNLGNLILEESQEVQKKSRQSKLNLPSGAKVAQENQVDQINSPQKDYLKKMQERK